MMKVLKHLWLAVALIAVASGILLLSDWERRGSSRGRLPVAAESSVADDEPFAVVSLAPEPGKHYSVALCYYVPAPVFEQAVDGFRTRMAAHGFVEGENLELNIQHANGDMSVLPQVTKSLLQHDPDVFVPFSTPCLASAIAHVHDVNIVFGIVSAPFAAGAGTAYDDHLPQVTGVVQVIPTTELFEWMRRLFPQVRRLGVLYNPSEANSVKELADLERMIQPWGLVLETVAVNTASEVPEGIQGLLARQVDMAFLMADNTVVSAMPAVVRACAKNGIPIIADDASLMGGGALMSCAPGPYSDGAQTAELVVQVLLGAAPRDMPITPSRDNEMALDLKAARQSGVALPVELLQRADLFFHVDALYNGPPRVALLNLVNNALLDEAEQGVLDALRQSGLDAGRDYTLTRYNAQGDMSQVPAIIDAAMAEQPDLVVTVTTPMLMAAVKKIKNIPLVFTVASDPVRLELFAPPDRPANLCGIHDNPPVDELVSMALRYNPQTRVLGTLYDPAQMNALISLEKLRESVQRRGLSLVEVSVSSVADIPMAAQSLVERGAEALILSADNVVATGFPAIHKTAAAAGVPVFTTEPSLVEQGATGAIGNDYKSWGRRAGRLAAGVLAGIPPSRQPIMPIRETVTVEPSNIHN